MAEPGLELLQTLVERSLNEQAQMRAEQATMRSEQATMKKDVANVLDLMVKLISHVQRIDRRVLGVRHEIELMLRAELMGQLGNFEARIDQRLAGFAEHPPASAL